MADRIIACPHKARDGFSSLSAHQSHKVLRPFSQAVTGTTVEAIAPPLSALSDPFLLALVRTEDEANKVDLSLRNREVSSEAEVQTLVGEIRDRLVSRESCAPPSKLGGGGADKEKEKEKK